MRSKGRYGAQYLTRNFRLCLGARNVLSCWIRSFLLLFVISFIWIQITFGTLFWLKNSNETSHIGNHISVKNDSRYEEQTTDSIIEISDNDSINEHLNLIAIREIIRKYNQEQNIINEDIYNPLSNDSVVIVIQVHNRINYLKYLIGSLSKAKHVNETLLIFSHDVYDEDISRLIQSITFCKVIQIFLPHSIQAHPNEFPGNDPNDCPRDIGKKRAIESNCIGAEHPDKYGHYRESKFTQIKHHWWWKVNHVFNHLNVTRSFMGFVTFLEEDHYVAEDFIYLLKMMYKECANIVDCYFLGLGPHVNLKQYKVFKDADQVKMSPLTTNLGLTFNRTTFDILLGCSKQFCEFDDYNWDWTLNSLVQTCTKIVLRSMIPVGPRLFHTGECGTHIHKQNCKEDKLILEIQNVLKSAKDKLYPSSISVTDTFIKSSKIKENGGWGDKRDHELCINMTKR